MQINARSIVARQKAKMLLGHYISKCAKGEFRAWDNDNSAEVEQIVDEIEELIEARIEIALQRMGAANVNSHQ